MQSRNDVFVLLTAMLGLSGCGEQLESGSAQRQTDSNNSQTQISAPAITVAPRNTDVAQLSYGGQVYQQHCAVCHGSNAEGAVNWHQRDKDGKFPAPPLNGTGHAWHHPQKALEYTIKNGTVALGGNMPAWKDTLSDSDIKAVIAWFQQKWPDELYQAWEKTNEAGR